MIRTRKLAPLLVVAIMSSICGASQKAWSPQTPPPLPETTWLNSYDRLCFGIDGSNLDAAIKDGTNVICGGTNAAGIGFAGGPFILGENGEFVDIRSGVPVPEQTLNELKGRVQLAHARHAKVLGEVIRFYMSPWIQQKHPDWQVVNSPGEKPITVEQLKTSAVLGCWNSPYGDWFIKSQVALVKRIDWDGYNMDGFGCWSQCFCPYCEASYRADTGKDIPATGNVNDLEFRHYLKWRLDRYTKFVARWTGALKAVKPDFVAAPWSTGPGRWWHWMGAPAAEGSDGMHRVLDAPFVELLWDFPADQSSNLLPAFTCRYYRGLTGDKPAWMLPYQCEQGQFNMQPPVAECDLREMTVLTNGCLPAQGYWQQSETATLVHLNKMQADREPFTRGSKSLKWAAMLVGESSRLLYGLTGVRTETPIGAWMGSGVDSPDFGKLPASERRMPAHMESSVGVFRAMMEDHLPLDIITEPDVEDATTLSQYKVLILPNAACLNDRALAVIRSFVKSGGGIVSLHESSLCNGFGDRQTDFGLADLFGAHYKGVEDFSARWPTYAKWTEVYLGILAPDLHPIADDPVVRANYRRGSDRLQYIGWATNVTVDTGATKLGRRLQTPTEWPFMVLNQPGKGRSAYFAEDMGQAYFIAPYQYQRRLITNAVRWAAAGSTPPVTVQAPLCVQAAFYTQKSGFSVRTVVHLLNEINTSSNRGLPFNNPSEREETVPISNIRVTIAGQPQSAYLEPGHEPLTIKRTATGSEVTVPSLDVHCMVVFQ